MNANNVTLTVPAWVLEGVQFLERNWTAIVGIVVIALLSSIVTWLVRHHFKLDTKLEEAKAKKVVRWIIVAVSSGFTLLGYLIFFLNGHASLLAQLPVIGRSESEVLGAMYVLYNFRLNTTFKNWEAKLEQWSGAKANQTTTATQPTETAPSSFL